MPRADIPTILVPHGAEHEAVRRGVHRSAGMAPDHRLHIVPIPIGQAAVRQFLQSWQPPTSRVLVMGLCGGLQLHHTIGSAVLYDQCVFGNLERYWCDRALTDQLHKQLSASPAIQPRLATGLTSDRLICSAQEKRSLGQLHQADVVDMEGVAILKALQPETAVAMLRVVSDDCRHTIPDLSAAITPEGALRRRRLAIGLIRQPIASLRLIRGSLQGLKHLQAIAAELAAQL